MHNVNVQVFTSAGTPGVQPVAFLFRSLIEQGGCLKDDDYPYRGIQSDCKFDANKVAVKVTDCRSYNLTSQEKVKQFLYKYGPIAIAVKAYGLAFYRGGIISDEECIEGEVNHAVLLVGYGTDGDNPYWIVKNSWGDGFGEQGYYRMHRGEGADSCGMINIFMATTDIA